MQSVSRVQPVKIYVATHKDVEHGETECLKFLHTECANGINIAEKEDYCELRTQYFVWKNKDYHADYVGFFHYRRYLDLNRSAKKEPYHIEKEPDYTLYTEKNLAYIPEMFDVVTPIAEYMGISVLTRYKYSKGHDIDDLMLLAEIINDEFPKYARALKQYFEGEYEYFGNMYIMRLDLFTDYCDWLFRVLEIFDERKPNHLPRTEGYLGERLFGVYYTWLKSQKGIRVLEVPRVFYSKYDDSNHHFGRDRFVNMLLPPGGNRRATLRRLKLRVTGIKDAWEK